MKPQKPQKPPRQLSRRELLASSAAFSAAWLLSGCATNPVTGQSQLMLVSEAQEIEIDRTSSPHQIASDYGLGQDGRLNDYLTETGRRLASITHRPRMPYSFRCVNAPYVNAYAFPGGTIAITRGILLQLESEAELAALMGHELGHVNARHTAEQMTTGSLAQLLIGGLAVASGGGELAAQLGGLGAGALLAKYSRDNEREADGLGMEYMVRAGYSPQGFIDLMDMLRTSSKESPGALEVMFSTHPMSQERYQNALQLAQRHAGSRGLPLHRDRYMDHTAHLRSMRKTIELEQKGEELLAKKRLPEAEQAYRSAIAESPNDFAGQAMLAKCLLMQKKIDEGADYARQAKAIAPNEAMGYHLSGFAAIAQKNYQEALDDYRQYDRLLPGNPNTAFFMGYANEGLRRIDEAARHYSRFLQSVRQGEQAKHASQRLVDWGYVAKPAPRPTGR